MLKRLGAFFLDILEVVVFAGGIFLIVYLLLIRPHKIKGDSMQPNFPDGEYLFTEKVTYYFNEPKRGDVVVFKPEVSEDDFIKRIIGIPGDEISIVNGKVYINGEILNESYLASDLYTNSGNFLTEGKKFIVPEGTYMAFGDNRPNSYDSRGFGPISKKSLAGRAWLIYWPIKKAGVVKNPIY